VISAVTATGVTATSATITWTTDEGSDSQVEWGIATVSENSSLLDPALVTSHSVTLTWTGIAAGTVVRYRVLSRDGAGNLQASEGLTFTVPQPPDPPEPPDDPPPTNDDPNNESDRSAFNASIFTPDPLRRKELLLPEPIKRLPALKRRHQNGREGRLTPVRINRNGQLIDRVPRQITEDEANTINDVEKSQSGRKFMAPWTIQKLPSARPRGGSPPAGEAGADRFGGPLSKSDALIATPSAGSESGGTLQFQP
jgi:hypothetical protein